MKIFKTFFMTFFIISVSSLYLDAEYKNEILPSEAVNYIGKEVRIAGTIVDTYDTGNLCLLNFSSSFTAVIYREDYSKFSEFPDDFYYGKRVRICGTVIEYKGKPEIILKSTSQIQFLESYEMGDEIKKEIPWDNAHKFYGKMVTVYGKIISFDRTEKMCILRFHNNWKRYVSIVIFKGNFKNFPEEPEKIYMDKNVKVHGLVRSFKGRPEIVVKKPSQIKVLN